MNQVKKCVCSVLLLSAAAVGILFAHDTTFKGPYTDAQIAEYRSMLQKGMQYEADNDVPMAIKTYIEAICAYPVIAQEASDQYLALYKLLSEYEKPGRGQYNSDDELIAGFNTLIDDTRRYLCENAQFDLIISSTLRTEYDLDEYTSYWGNEPGFIVSLDLNWFYGAYFRTMEWLLDRGTHSLRYKRPEEVHRLGEDAFYHNREVMDFTFEITDKNGTVIVPAEKISQWRPNPEHCTVDPTWTYSYERFYVIKDISGKAKELWLSGSDAFTVRLKSCSITLPDATVLYIDTSRFTTYKGELPSSINDLYPDYYYGGFTSVVSSSRTRWDIDQMNLNYESAQVAGLTYLPGKVEGTGPFAEVTESLFILPVTRDLFAEVTGNDYATGSDSESYKMQVFLNLCNLKSPDAPEFSFYNRDELESRYNYRNNDALFFVGIQAKDLDPATFSGLEQ